jgi:RNA-directed DNA polymerase
MKMEWTKEDQRYIKDCLVKGRDITDLLNLINWVIQRQNQAGNTKYLLISEKSFKFTYAKINSLYGRFEIPKKTGGTREILAPTRQLKKIQRRINLILNSLFIPKNAAHGFVSNRSIVTNAKIHVAKKHVLNIDLKDFFPSTHFGRVRAVLKLQPFEMSDQMAHYIANFCCYQGKLPQGAPTSPTLTNIVCRKLDYKLVEFAKSKFTYYTRYADDMTFSCDKNKFTESFHSELTDIITSEGFVVNDKKTRHQRKYNRQEVTGITVNEKLNVSRNYIRNIRAILSNWEKQGYEKATLKFMEHYPNEKGYSRNKVIPKMENVVHGKIMFLGMVRGKEDKIYKQYLTKYNKLHETI